MLTQYDEFLGWMRRAHPNVSLTKAQTVFVRNWFDEDLSAELTKEFKEAYLALKVRGAGKSFIAMLISEFGRDYIRRWVEESFNDGSDAAAKFEGRLGQSADPDGDDEVNSEQQPSASEHSLSQSTVSPGTDGDDNQGSTSNTTKGAE